MNSDKHKAKMAAKKARVQVVGFTPIDGKRSRALLTQFHLRYPGRPLPIHPDDRRYDMLRVKPVASINRHTGQPHLHLRERARNLGVEQSSLAVATKPKRARKSKAAA